MTDQPLVSVVMGVYNSEPYLRQAVESILDQTYRHFEFIIVNDGSTDGSADILASYERTDPRVHVYHQQNQGVSATLNRGCHLAMGKYNARMDADDVSLPERLAKQVSYMEGHPHIGVLGTWTQPIDEGGRPLKSWSMPSLPGVVGWSLLFGNCIAHPSAIFRQQVLEQVDFYALDVRYAEDYELWTRVFTITQIANLPEILVQKRVSAGNISNRHHEDQEQTVLQGMLTMHTRLLRSDVSAETVACLRQLSCRSRPSSLRRVELTVDHVHRLYNAYIREHSLSEEERREVAKSAARKLYLLSAKAGQISRSEGLAVSMRALRQGPRWATARTLTKAMRKRARNALVTTYQEG